MFQIAKNTTAYKPLACYIPQEQKALELQMFSRRCSDLRYQLEQFRKETVHPEALDNNPYYLHLEWLLERGEDRICVVTCPHCSKKPVAFFRSGTVYGGTQKFFMQNHNFIYCEDCVKTVPPQGEWIYPFKFSVIRSLYRKYDRNFLREIIPLFKYVFGLKPRLTKEEAFEFFSKEPITIVNREKPQTIWTEPIPSSGKGKKKYEEQTIPLSFE